MRRLGLTLPFPGVPLAAHEPLVRRAEARGYDDLWSAETNGADGFTPLVLAATWTERVRLGTGIVNPFTRGPAVLAQHAAALADASGGRFVLGLGSSSDVIVEGWNEIPFARPRSRVRAAVETLRPVLAGGRGPGGFRLDPPPAHPVPIVVAALRDRMLRLGGELADGTFVNFVPLSAAERVVARVREGEAAAGRGPTEVIGRFFCFPGDAEAALPMARRLFAGYATVPVYARFFEGLGWGEALAPALAAWKAGDRREAVRRIPEALVREVFVFGEPAAQRERLEAFAAAGITTTVLAPMAPPDALEGLIDAWAP
jgi:probable F420-dependent oxidoreductase